MPFDGSGNFVRSYNWSLDAANGVPITASRFDTEHNGFATGLSNCITRDSQGKPTADIDWNAHKIKNLADPTLPQDAVTLAFVNGTSGLLQIQGSQIVGTGTLDNTVIEYPQTTAENSASVTPVNLYIQSNDAVGVHIPLRDGADPSGVADSRTALNNASLIGKPIRLTPGTYLVNSNVTISPNVIFEPGAILKPAAGVTITLSSTFQAGVYQIFDLSLGGLIALPLNLSEVWAEWWGAKGDGVKTNNEVPFNQAWYALAQTISSTSYGGTINFERGLFLISGTVFSSDNIVHKGHDYFFSCVLANSGTWNGANSMFQSQSQTTIKFTAAPIVGATSATLTSNWTGSTTTYTVVFFETAGAACETRTVTLTNGTTTATWAGGLSAACTVNAIALTYSALFNNRIENMRIHAGSISSITRPVYAPSWQQKCGTDNVYIQNFLQYGIYMDNGYGGAAQLRFRRTELFADPACVAGSYGIYANFTTYTTGWLTLVLEEVQCAAFLATVTFTGALVAATSATLTSNWIYPTGAWNVAFSDGSYRLVTLTNGATTATWTGAVTATANATGISPNSSGISGNGRVILNCDDVHFEQLQNGFVLQNACRVVGNSVKADGNNTVQNIINCSASWTGTINLNGMMRGGATTYIQDNSRGPYPLANGFGSGVLGLAGCGNYNDRTIWPPDPSIPIAACRTVGGAANAAPSYQTGTFFGTGASILHIAAGQYRFNMGVAAFGLNTYDVEATSDQGQIQVVFNSASQFDIFTRNNAGVLTDSGPISVKVYHTP